MNAEWPFVRRDRGNTAAVPTSGPETDPNLLWAHDAERRVFGTPLVVGDGVYVATWAQTHDSIDCAVAIDRESGDRKWMTASNAMEPSGTPAVVDGDLYLGDLDGRLFVADVETGIVTRSIDRLGTTPPDGVCPLIDNGTMFVNMYRLRAYETENLNLRWEWDEEWVVEEPVAIANGRLFVGVRRTTDERVYVGQDDSGVSSYVFRSDPFVRAVDPETGAVRWETSVDGRPRTPAVVDGTVFVVTAGSDPQGTRGGLVKPCTDEQPIPDADPEEYRTFGSVHALDAETGEEQWSTRLASPVRSMPAVDGRYVCFGTMDGHLVAVDANTGEQEWQYRVNEDRWVSSSPTIAGELVYVGSYDGHLAAVDLQTGEKRWRFETENPVEANPSVVDGVVYVADSGGTVYALE